ncbi:MAG: hypothetical protein IKS09_06880 [Lachnospiraceae bacterium]|nr:hypothetical protein [Lachnospiraceae bacterium]
MTNETLPPLACPNCGCKVIGVKDIAIPTPWKKEIRRTWAYCKRCGHKGPEGICNIEASKLIEVNSAIKAWNKHVKAKSSWNIEVMSEPEVVSKA